eukprot:TRINITY_DN2772_c0_g1_i2.p1 TRINITY_DN2772_c0_g1~~TRINITY_DN2772_c0_g1_i2.p1  ORF type:complete len:232 (+),score=58.57 TRINITY_DN2772_c0_g1_i2:105-800(+)
MEDEKYSFSHSNQLFTCFEKFTNLLSKSRSAVTGPPSVSSTPLSSGSSASVEKRTKAEMQEVLEKEAKHLYHALRCVHVSQRISSKVVKTTIRPDKIPNLIKNLTRLVSPPMSNFVKEVEEDVYSIIRDGQRWNSVRSNSMTADFLIGSAVSIQDHMEQIVNNVKVNKTAEARKLLIAVNGFYILQMNFGISACLLGLSIISNTTTLTEQQVISLKRMVANQLSLASRLLS